MFIESQWNTRQNHAKLFVMKRCTVHVFLSLPYPFTLPCRCWIMWCRLLWRIFVLVNHLKYCENIKLFSKKKENHKQSFGPFANYNRWYWICYQDPILTKVSRAAKLVIATVLSTRALGPVFLRFGEGNLIRCPLLKIFMNPVSN